MAQILAEKGAKRRVIDLRTHWLRARRSQQNKRDMLRVLKDNNEKQISVKHNSMLSNHAITIALHSGATQLIITV
ncbi:unnamed protein product [Onchocerca flexuosa]|uniref:ANK_REP_REGION domain-containing protein n=1 Tax=Onchocerca flexuosa TaxID=387005 RepID=A0A183HJA6_9BILA|nr:unnamed protein product [Onchocerca flexuosa]